MPSTKVITPLIGGNYYHLFNRGINRQNIFFQERNYYYFLELLDRFVGEYISVLAYCLLPNHFHLVIKINDVIKIPSLKKDGISETVEVISDENEIGKFVRNQFRTLFITYSMAINKQENRTGSLFDKNFKRLEIAENEYLLYSIFYTHYNSEKHGVSENFREYMFSSYKAIVGNRKTKIDKDLVLALFDGLGSFINYHNVLHNEKDGLLLE